MTVEADPVGGRVVALVLPLPALLELHRDPSKVELQAVDEVTQAGQDKAFVDPLGLHLEHANRLPN